MWSIWLIYFLAAAAASVIAISIGWRGQSSVSGSGSKFDSLSDMPPPAPTAADNTETVADAAAVIMTTARRLVPAIQRQHVHLDVAAEPGLLIRLRPIQLTEFIEELVTLGLHGAMGGHLLLTASRSGGRIDIALSDDQPTDDGASARQTEARRLSQRVALHGGALDVVAQPELGTTMTLKLAAATERPAVVDGSKEARVLAQHSA